ncbi:TonB-dependent receptor [Fulvivirgaceae bacterium BMA12]|uniref:TonB-dependent receptor n=1 Tax=Agaribacillus aureus TaxID=3051825 RepID=A0ABT8LID9_9BACT|nr:TonB-dependent receptor [Fulvivirgaceae bacterium BMA12]
MKLKSHYFCLLLFSILSNTASFAQNTAIEITGKVVEEGGRQPIEFATVLVADTYTKRTITGTTTGENGNFQLKTSARDFYIEISFVGFAKRKFENPTPVNGKIDLETIVLSQDQQLLDEMVVRGERSQTEFKLDKRVFNVGKDLSSTGASALEVLNNVPSVNVNIEGQVSLRGSTGVQMLINGKPSVIASEEGNALGTLTAEMIEKVEVITVPSAKYEAEGTTGIINIVLKKEDTNGLNGSVTLNTGTPNNHSLGLSVNKRTEKLNLFGQFGIGRRTFPSDNESVNQDLINETRLESFGKSYKNESFINVILGTDYYINKYNVLTLSGHFAYEKEDEDSDTDFSFLEAGGGQTGGSRRLEITEATNPKWQYELQYQKNFERNKEQSLLFSALGNFFGKDQRSDFENITTLGSDPNSQQQTRTDFSEAQYTFKLDYVHPFLEKYTLETGAQYEIKDVTNDFAVSDLLDGVPTNNPDLTNIFDYDQKVFAVYSTAALENDKWGVKLGLRWEHTDVQTLLQNTNERNDLNFSNLFPSAHTSYKLSEHSSVQAGYSKRIRRPRLWDLNPFFNIRNNFSIFTGNPNLLPEFTDLYEITSIHELGSVSLNLGLYYRYTKDVVERVTRFENNVSTSRPENIGTNNVTGVEVNAKYIPSKWLSVSGDFNYNHFSRDGTFEATSFNFDGDQWSTRITAKFKFPLDIDMEISGDYRSRYQTFQQEISENIFADFGLRKKILKGKTILNLSIRDVFASRVFETITEQPDFYLSNSRQRGRFVTFGISFGFGKGEAMEFSGQKRF